MPRSITFAVCGRFGNDPPEILFDFALATKIIEKILTLSPPARRKEFRVLIHEQCTKSPILLSVFVPHCAYCYIFNVAAAILYSENDHVADGFVAKLEKLSAYFEEIYTFFLGSVDYLTKENVEHDQRY